jgi:hypothetical protein
VPDRHLLDSGLCCTAIVRYSRTIERPTLAWLIHGGVDISGTEDVGDGDRLTVRAAGSGNQVWLSRGRACPSCFPSKKKKVWLSSLNKSISPVSFVNFYTCQIKLLAVFSNPWLASTRREEEKRSTISDGRTRPKREAL